MEARIKNSVMTVEIDGTILDTIPLHEKEVRQDTRTLQQKLEKWYAEYYANGKTITYGRNAMPEIYQLNLLYRQENPKEYGYNATIKAWILTRENLSGNALECLDTEIYLSQSQIRNEQKAKDEAEMLAAGWLKLTADIIKQAFQDKKMIEIQAVIEREVFTRTVNDVLKPFVDADGNCYLMKPRARSRGLRFCEHTFKSAFCKIVKE